MYNVIFVQQKPMSMQTEMHSEFTRRITEENENEVFQEKSLKESELEDL